MSDTPIKILGPAAKAVAEPIAEAAGLADHSRAPLTVEQQIERIFFLLRDYFGRDRVPYREETLVAIDDLSRNLQFCDQQDSWIFAGRTYRVEVDSPSGRFVRTLNPGWQAWNFPVGTSFNGVAGEGATVLVHRLSDENPGSSGGGGGTVGGTVTVDQIQTPVVIDQINNPVTVTQSGPVQITEANRASTYSRQTVGAAAVQLVASSAANKDYGLVNGDLTRTLWIGGAGVTPATGFPIGAGGSHADRSADAVFGVYEDATTAVVYVKVTS